MTLNGVGEKTCIYVDIPICISRRLLDAEKATGAKTLLSGQVWCVYGTERRSVRRVLGGDIRATGRVSSDRALLAKVGSLISL